MTSSQAQVCLCEHHLRIAHVVIAHWKRLCEPRFLLLRKRKMENNHFLATVHYRVAIVRKAFASWRKFIAIIESEAEQRKQLRHEYLKLLCQRADVACSFFVVRNAWCCWKDQYSRQKLLQEKLQGFQNEKCLVVKRSVISCWCQYAALRRKKKVQDQLLLQQYDFQLQQKFLRFWWVRVQFRMEDEALIQKAQQMQLARRLLKSFTFWKSRLADIQESRFRFQIAVTSSNRNLCLGALQTLRRYAHYRKHQRKLTDQLFERFASTVKFIVKRYYFGQWVARTKESLQDTINHAHALQFNHLHLTRLSWHAWVQYIRARKLKHLHEQSAGCWYTRHLTSQAFDRWRIRLQSRRLDRSNHAAAVSHELSSVIRRAWIAWVAFVRIQKEKKDEIQEAQALHRLMLLKRGAIHWLEVGLARRSQRVYNSALAESERAYHRHRLLQNLLIKYKRRKLLAVAEAQVAAATARHSTPADLMLDRRASLPSSPSLPQHLSLQSSLPNRCEASPSLCASVPASSLKALELQPRLGVGFFSTVDFLLPHSARPSPRRGLRSSSVGSTEQGRTQSDRTAELLPTFTATVKSGSCGVTDSAPVPVPVLVAASVSTSSGRLPPKRPALLYRSIQPTALPS